MSDSKPAVGIIGWIDLTVKDADRLKDFYKEVGGWDTSSVSIGDYNDFNVSPPARKIRLPESATPNVVIQIYRQHG